MNRLKSIGLAILLVLAFGFGFYQSCLTKHTVNSWGEYCAYIDGDDLYHKYRVAMIGFDFEAIRNEFVHKYHDAVIGNAKEQLFQNKSNFVLSELERLKMLGVWREGTHLHVANNLVTSDDSFGGIPKFSEWANQYKNATNPDALKDKRDRPSHEYCVFRTMNDLFEDLTLHGEKETATIPLQNSKGKRSK
jgi:hypothetical protein